MCILFATSKHPDYKLILLSNRDEFFTRPTSNTSWHHNDEILSPFDLARKDVDHGTWLGMNRYGKIAVLLNQNSSGCTAGVNKVIAPISRGLFPVEFLENNKQEFEWDTYNKFNAALSQKFGENVLDNTAKFTMFCGDATERNFRVLFSGETSEVDECVVSNRRIEEPESEWPKVSLGLHELQNVYSLHNKEDIIEELWRISTINNVTTDDLVTADRRNTIFVPPLSTTETFNRLTGKYYGTRMQIIIIVDNNNNVTFLEKTLHSSDMLDEIPQLRKFEFTCESHQ